MKKEDVTIINETLSEFEIDEDFSLFFSHTSKVWFIEDFEEDGKITILIDKENQIFLEKVFMYKGKEISNDLINSYQKIVDLE